MNEQEQERKEVIDALDVYITQLADGDWKPDGAGNVLVDPVCLAVLSHWWAEFKAGREIG